MNKNNGFSDFLDRTLSQKEISLIIVEDDGELNNFQDVLSKKGFRQAIGIYQLLTNITFPNKVFFRLNENLAKDVYDFVVQYPTGQIEIFDKDRMNGKITKPSYENVSVIFITTRKNLGKIQKEGYSLLSNVGMTYQI